MSSEICQRFDLRRMSIIHCRPEFGRYRRGELRALEAVVLGWPDGVCRPLGLPDLMLAVEAPHDANACLRRAAPLAPLADADYGFAGRRSGAVNVPQARPERPV